MFYLCDCCCYKWHKWTLYILCFAFGGLGVAFMLASSVWYVHDRPILPNHIVEMCLATSILSLGANIIGFRGARRADDVHEQHGRNYSLALFVGCTVAVAVIIAVQVNMGARSVEIVNTCALGPADCPLDLASWIDRWQSYFIDQQPAWDCCGLDPYDHFAMSTAWNSTCPPLTPDRPGCRWSIMAMAWTLCVTMLVSACVMLTAMVVCSIAASCLCCCRFPHRTISGYALDGHEFSMIGRQRSLNHQVAKKDERKYQLMDSV